MESRPVPGPGFDHSGGGSFFWRWARVLVDSGLRRFSRPKNDRLGGENRRRAKNGPGEGSFLILLAGYDRPKTTRSGGLWPGSVGVGQIGYLRGRRISLQGPVYKWAFINGAIYKLLHL